MWPHPNSSASARQPATTNWPITNLHTYLHYTAALAPLRTWLLQTLRHSQSKKRLHHRSGSFLPCMSDFQSRSQTHTPYRACPVIPSLSKRITHIHNIHPGQRYSDHHKQMITYDITGTPIAHDTTSLLDNIRSQHTHLIQIGKLIGDPNTDHPYPPLTHAIHNLARTLNIPSSQHLIANPRPTTQQ